MRIQHNIMAMSAYRNYTNNVSAMKKNLEKLSSGYKINRAGDDAAGLAISEKMRAQITGLETAQKNAKDGISLVQTAEGALTEVHDMLNRMVELATQSANGTYDDTTDRFQLQKEMDQLRSEINRIADSANFNGIKLLDGSLGSGTVSGNMNVTVINDAENQTSTQTAAKGVYTLDLSELKAANSGSATGTIDVKIGGVHVATISVGPNTSSTAITLGTAGSAATTSSVKIAGVTFTVAKTGTTGLTLTMAATPTEAFKGDMTVSFTAGSTAVTFDDKGGTIQLEITTAPNAGSNRVLANGYFALSSSIVEGSTINIDGTEKTFTFDGSKTGSNYINLSDMKPGKLDMAVVAQRTVNAFGTGTTNFYVTGNNKDGNIYLSEKVANVSNGKATWDLTADGSWDGVVKYAAGSVGGSTSGLTLQIGDTAESYNQLNVTINDCHTSSLGIGSIKISDQASAQSAVDAIKQAINYVSDVRGTLGATQNRLDHTINNLSVMTENIQDAESTIRDVDVAEEMMAYTKNNILIQSAQAMLAQANQVPQGVLQLLQ